MKRAYCFLLVIIICLSCFCGCDNHSLIQQTHNYPTELPQYLQDKQLEIMAFWSPPINEQQYTWMKECGITAIVVDNKYDASSAANRKRILSMCGDLGIDVYFPLDRTQTGDTIESTYGAFVDYPAFKGFFCDEPITKQHIDNIASQYKVMNALDPKLTFIGNLLGGYSEDPSHYAWIFGSDEEYQTALADGQFFPNYSEYIQYYSDTVIKNNTNVRVSATNYPLLAYDKGYENTLSSKWLETLGETKDAAQYAGVDMWQFISTTGSHNGGNTNYKRQPTEADIRWQSYVALAYGASGIAEFVYTTAGAGAEFTAEDHGPIWWVDQNNYSSYYRTEVYDYAQAVHQELTKFDHVLLSFNWQGVLLNNVTGDPNTTSCFERAVGVLSEHERIQKMQSSKDLLIGCFKDEKNYDGFLMVNFDETAHNSHLRNTVSVEFSHAKKALVYVYGEEQIVELKNNTYTCTLLPGEAVFVIPIA